MKITEEYIDSLRTERGGWTRETLESLGVAWPPKRGWRKALIGKRRKNRKKQLKPWLRTAPTTPQPMPKKPVEEKISAWSRKASLFYRSREWSDARYDALKRSKGTCELCGRGKMDGAVLNVDHIKPIRYHWELRLVITNLQVLCGMCNRGKGNRDETDWREKDVEMTERWRDLVKE